MTIDMGKVIRLTRLTLHRCVKLYHNSIEQTVNCLCDATPSLQKIARRGPALACLIT